MTVAAAPAMVGAPEDWAVVIGIACYPQWIDPLSNLPMDLNGPVNDANEFIHWLKTSAGVPGNQIFCPPSPSPPSKPPAPGLVPQPSLEAIENLFIDLNDMADARAREGLSRRIGRRLYVYFAGHGMDMDTRTEDSGPSIITANAKFSFMRHFAGRPILDYFRHLGYFDEILLFMDCCRELNTKITPYVPPMDLKAVDPNVLGSARYLYGYAANWRGTTREKKFSEKTHGIFTYALLDALRGQARLPNGDVTVKSLCEYLFNNLKNYLDENERADPTIPNKPDLKAPLDPSNDFVIVTLQPPDVAPSMAQVTITFKAGDAGKQFVLEDGDFNLLETIAVDAALTWTKALKKGTYSVREVGGGRERIVQVRGKEPIHA